MNALSSHGATSQGTRLRKLVKDRQFVFCAVVVAVLSLLYVVPIITVGIDSIRMVDVFDSDETIHAQFVSEALKNGTFKINFYYYGQFFFILALVILKAIALFTPVTEFHILLAQRMVASLSSAGALMAIFALGTYLVGALSGWLALGALAIFPTFLHRAVSAHPENLQIFLLIVAMLSSCRVIQEPDWKRWFFISSVLSGLAFSVKYSGLFLLPGLVVGAYWRLSSEANHEVTPRQMATLKVVGVSLFVVGCLFLVFRNAFLPDSITDRIIDGGALDPHFISVRRTGKLAIPLAGLLLFLSAQFYSTRKFLNEFLFLMTAMAVLFFTAFVCTSPHTALSLKFIPGIIEMNNQLRTGQGLAIQQRLIPYLIDNLGIVIPTLAICAALTSLFQGIRSLKSRKVLPIHLLVLICFLYLTKFALTVNWRQARYLNPILPFLLILASVPLYWALGASRRKWGNFAALTVLTAFVGLIGFSMRDQIETSISYRKSLAVRELRPAIVAGNWLSEHYEADVPLVYDENAYVPPRFLNTVRTKGGTADLLTPNIRVVIVAQERASYYADPANAEKWYKGPDQFLAIHNYYKGLFDGTLGFNMVKSFSSLIFIFEREDLVVASTES